VIEQEMNEQDLIADLRRVAESLGQETLSRSQFARHGRVSSGLIEKRFGTWNKALMIAGLMPNDRFKRLSDEELETEFLRVHDKLGKTPTRNEFALESVYSAGVYERRFGNWAKAVNRYFGSDQFRPIGSQAARSAPRTTIAPAEPSQYKRSTPRRMFGAPLNFRELRHEPINEQGVVYLFGMVARELGFLVEGVATEFPDCDAKRMTKSGLYERVRIEFEFRSRNFREHGHNENDCDLVVCWIHDWPECPAEVLELSSAIKRLDAHV